MSSRLLEDLHPAFRPSVRAWIADVEDEVCWKIRVFTTYRGAAEQELEKALGKSKAAVWQSAHQYGLGIDVVPLFKGVALWKWDLKNWSWLAAKGKEHGIDWAGWRSIFMRDQDPYHFQHPTFRAAGYEMLLGRLRGGADLVSAAVGDAPWRPRSMTKADLAVKASWEVA